MSVLDRDALESSPLADLHAIATELSIDGFRRLRKEDLIERIITRQEGGEDSASEGDAEAEPAPRSRRRKPAAAKTKTKAKETEAESEPAEAEAEAEADAGEEPGEDSQTSGGRRRRGRRGGRGRTQSADTDTDAADTEAAEAPARSGRNDRSSRGASASPGADPSQPAQAEAEESVEGVVELLGNGSGFVRTSPPDPSDSDVYISAAQVKRCELVNGDRVSGPRRAPRRSERFASLVRVDTINGRPASEVSEGAHYDELPAAFPADRFRLGSDDATLKAIEFLTPFGRGSRVAIVGGSRAGKSFALRNLGQALTEVEGLQLFVALAGVRPEELAEWPREGALAPGGALSFAASPDALDHVVELVVDQARRIAARGADAVVLIDTLDGLHPQAARKAMAAARNIVDGGSLTVIATSAVPLGGETTVIALDPKLTAAGRFPALDLVTSGTIRPELLVGEAGAEAIAEARSQTLDGQ